jgi:hypothetical protein
MTGQCEALTGREAGGHPCMLAAKHQHTDAEGAEIQVCAVHFRMLKRFAREGLDSGVIARWRTPPA